MKWDIVMKIGINVYSIETHFSASKLKARVHLRCPSFHIFDFSSETAERNLTGRKISMSSTKFVFFRADRKNKMAAPASDWLRHFNFSETAEQNSTKLVRKQDLNVLYQFCVFFGPIGKTKWTPPPPDLCLAEIFSTSPLTPLNGIQRNLTGMKISMPSTKFVFFGPIEKPKWPPGLWLAETFSISSLKRLNGIQRNLTVSKISTSPLLLRNISISRILSFFSSFWLLKKFFLVTPRAKT